MGIYRRKPGQPVEAYQYNPGEGLVKGICKAPNCDSHNIGAHVHTIHNNQVVKVEAADWVLPEPDGKHFYPVKDEIFQNIYEEIGNETSRKRTKIRK